MKEGGKGRLKTILEEHFLGRVRQGPLTPNGPDIEKVISYYSTFLGLGELLNGLGRKFVTWKSQHMLSSYWCRARQHEMGCLAGVGYPKIWEEGDLYLFYFFIYLIL